eukprot:6214368-Pleurochrysis_carterae.AAC.6
MVCPGQEEATAQVDAHPGSGIHRGLGVGDSWLDGVGPAAKGQNRHDFGLLPGEALEGGSVAARRSRGAVQYVHGMGGRIGPEGRRGPSGRHWRVWTP